ncbi:cellulase (glycosyl hydrolase family 5) domain-containing protein [Sarocladium implicatum]|nr:cellulase (glycosyl hydrolase family 5) domain-containing protein [Sarocladium implicatum]
MKRNTLLLISLLAQGTNAWLPQSRDLPAFNQTARFEQLGKRFEPSLPDGVTKIRGVNLGGWLISEPWMMGDHWKVEMGCDGTDSELDCMTNVYGGDNRDKGNAAFQKHWEEWVTPDTVQSIHDVGLNTIRIPIGYWAYKDIVDYGSEPFADSAPMLGLLDKVVQKAADLGIYVIIDFHGAPGAQQEDAFTGQIKKPAGFFTDDNFNRAEKWLSWMTTRIHTNDAYKTVGMIEVLNEPVSNHDGDRYPAPGQVPGLLQSYYPGALAAVRKAEDALQPPVSDAQRLHVQFMSEKWGSGDPRTVSEITADSAVAFDDHNYIGFALQGSDRADQYKLMHSACTDNRVVDGQDLIIAGEWSMTSDVAWQDADFFKKFFTAQQQLYEKPGMAGWVFWTWKTELDDPRWTYSKATYEKLVPQDAAALEKNVYQDVCAGYT